MAHRRRLEIQQQIANFENTLQRHELDDTLAAAVMFYPGGTVHRFGAWALSRGLRARIRSLYAYTSGDRVCLEERHEDGTRRTLSLDFDEFHYVEMLWRSSTRQSPVTERVWFRGFAD